MVLLVLESDGACTSLNGHCARKRAVLVLVFEVLDLQRYRPPESCINQWFDKPSCCGCVSKKCELGKHEVVTLLCLCLVQALQHTE